MGNFKLVIKTIKTNEEGWGGYVESYGSKGRLIERAERLFELLAEQMLTAKVVRVSDNQTVWEQSH